MLVFWDSNLLSQRAKRAQWLLCGLRVWRDCCSSSFLRSWTVQPHGLETGSLIYFKGQGKLTRLAGACVSTSRDTVLWRPALRTHRMKILVLWEAMGYKCHGLQMPTLSSVTQNMNSSQWFQDENNCGLLPISCTSNISLETLWIPLVNDQ